MEKGSHVGQARGDVEAQATLVRCLARQRALALFEGMRSQGLAKPQPMKQDHDACTADAPCLRRGSRHRLGP